mgnify:CR=1 FL=1
MTNYKNNESELKICGHYFLVRFIENLRVEGDAHAWGRIHIGLQTIELERNCSDTKKEETIVHEVIHAIDDSLEFGFNEEQVCSLANALFQLGLGEKLMSRIDIPNL